VTRRILAGFALLLMAGFVALGVWQLQRRAWKHALIAVVESRIHAPPVAAPATAGAGDAYRRVRVTGVFGHDREALVQAVTERGGGFWVLTPLETPRFTVLVNRGFVPDRRTLETTSIHPVDCSPAKAGAQGLERNACNSGSLLSQRSGIASTATGRRITVTGLLRLTEPNGGFLRSNDPAADRWYSRDVAAIAQARGLRNTAPYFIDADATPNPGGYPVGGLTVVRFSDNHLVYALTWFALALLSLWAAWMVLRRPSPASHMDA
jgi:surfeit locus 1 family protein